MCILQIFVNIFGYLFRYPGVKELFLNKSYKKTPRWSCNCFDVLLSFIIILKIIEMVEDFWYSFWRQISQSALKANLYIFFKISEKF